jgi:hypothetical protein
LATGGATAGWPRRWTPASQRSKQLIAETRKPIAGKPGQPARHDYEYERNGVANLFMMFAPLEGWRHVKVIDRRAAVDYAHALKDLSDTNGVTRPNTEAGSTWPNPNSPSSRPSASSAASPTSRN